MTFRSIADVIVDDTVCVLYSADTGRIVHLHRVTTLGGLDCPSRGDIEEEARTIMTAAATGSERCGVEHLAAIFATPDAFERHTAYMVDPQSRRLTRRTDPAAQG